MLKKQIVLYYHHVGKASQDSRYKRMYVSPSILRLHILFLKSLNYMFTTVSDLQNHPDKKVAAITFDDGYTDNLTIGFPILKAQNVPATLYIITNDVGRKNITWSESGNAESVNLLDWDQLKILQNHGWEIGSHSSEHVHHDQLDRRGQEIIIGNSYKDLNHNLGPRIRSFCYPYGSYNVATVEVLQSLNIQTAVTTKSSSKHYQLELSRVSLYGQRVDHIFTSLAKILWSLL